MNKLKLSTKRSYSTIVLYDSYSLNRDRHVQNHQYFKVNFQSLGRVVSWCFWMVFRKIAFGMVFSEIFFTIFFTWKNDFFRKISRKSTFSPTPHFPASWKLISNDYTDIFVEIGLYMTIPEYESYSDFENQLGVR